MTVLSAPLKGISYMIVGSALLTLNDAVLKWLATDLSIGQLLAVRGGFALLTIILLAWRLGGRVNLRIHSLRAQTTRALLVVVSTFAYVTALRLMPLAGAIAITFAGPLFVTLLAVLVLREHVGWRRWAAVLVGFVGVIIMLRPSTEGFNWVALLPLASSLCGAVRDILTRRMSVTESSFATLGFTTLIVTLAGLCTLPFGWQPLTAHDLTLLAAASLLLGGAHFLLIETFRWAEASLVAPFKYSSFIWALFFGLLIWGDIPESRVIVGAVLVIASGLYIFRRETQRT